MHLYWHGQTCMKIQDNGITIAIDPYKLKTIKSPRMAADILLLTSKDFQSAASSISGDTFMIDSPGEYEVKGIFINGIGNNGNNDQVFYHLEVNGVTLAHLGRIKKGELTDKQLETIENVDILMIPVGGDDGATAKEAASLISQIEPKLVVPIYYQTAKTSGKLDKIDVFQKQMGIKAETVDKLIVKEKDIPQDEMRMIILKPQL
ncbi:MAG: MBL fold metallo-hydrolase [Candidatus Komeilibacteria bacterium]